MKQSLPATIAIALLGAVVMVAGAVFAIAMFAGDTNAGLISIGSDAILWIVGMSLYVLAMVRARILIGTDAVGGGGLRALRPRLGAGLRVFGYLMIALNTGLVVLILLGQGDATAYVQAPFGYLVGIGAVAAGRRMRRAPAPEPHGSAS